MSNTQPDPSSLVRQEVRQQSASLSRKTRLKLEEFDSKTEIVKTDDGTLLSRKSLLKQAGRQIVDDGGSAAASVANAVRGLLKR